MLPQKPAFSAKRAARKRRMPPSQPRTSCPLLRGRQTGGQCGVWASGKRGSGVEYQCLECHTIAIARPYTHLPVGIHILASQGAAIMPGRGQAALPKPAAAPTKLAKLRGGN
jgi:hypothetical protein